MHTRGRCHLLHYGKCQNASILITFSVNTSVVMPYDTVLINNYVHRIEIRMLRV